ncbi:MAG: hypothetical protein RL410_1050 [Actinomycetota bacterium]|jgi:beta-glucanase (GH16 family)
MKRTLTFIVTTAIVAVSLTMNSTTATAALTKKLLWSQEFKGSASTKLDSKIWGFDLGGLNANSEEQLYTSNRSNIALNGKGQLVITAIPIVEGSTNWEKCISCKFTSARIKTQDKVGFKYGRVEARIKMPAGTGTWPAFWMLGSNLDTVGWPESGELDIVEARGADSTIVFGTAHGPGYNGSEGSQIGNVAYANAPLSAGYHIYAIEWTPNKVVWYFDNVAYHTLTRTMVSPRDYVFNHEFFIILNLAMGGTFAGELDPNLGRTSMSVDYIRYYKLGNYGTVYKHK